MSKPCSNCGRPYEEHPQFALAVEKLGVEVAQYVSDDGEIACPAETDSAPIHGRRTEPSLTPIEWDSLWNRDRTNSFLVDPFIARGRQIGVYAPAKEGKSEVALWIAAQGATGRDLYGGRIDPVTVLYLDFEMTEDDLEERLRDFGYGPQTDLSHLVYILHAPLPPLDTARGGEALAAEIATVGAELLAWLTPEECGDPTEADLENGDRPWESALGELSDHVEADGIAPGGVHLYGRAEREGGER